MKEKITVPLHKCVPWPTEPGVYAVLWNDKFDSLRCFSQYELDECKGPSKPGQAKYYGPLPVDFDVEIDHRTPQPFPEAVWNDTVKCWCFPPEPENVVWVCWWCNYDGCFSYIIPSDCASRSVPMSTTHVRRIVRPEQTNVKWEQS